ncbi:MAG: retropepsin-like domain-containing protein [Crocinitomicaceae bacterium]|nr:retropepsin-like domain-containing protein [Flavobacteriales bacterium]NQZ38255.1 retropepsin-like domain-containing protein [Crocinitomicaceae bacterium]
MKKRIGLFITLGVLTFSFTSCSNQKKMPILKTDSKIVSVKDGNKLHEGAWTISSEVKLDEFIVSKFVGEKKVSFISDIDTLTFVVKPNSTYDFVIQYNKEKAFTRINTDTLKEASIPSEKILEYFYDNKNRKHLTDTLSFTLGIDNGIHLQGKINKSDTLDFLFDTGANALVIVSKLIGTKVTLKLDGNTENEGTDGTQTIATSSSNKLEIENLNWDNVRFLSIDYRKANFDGVLGWIAFENKIVEIDYEKNILIIHKSIGTIPEGYSKIETKMIGGVPYIKGTIIIGNITSSGWFEYDSGSNGSFSISQKFAADNNLNEKMKLIGSSSSSGSTGIEWKANDYILPKLTFGEFELSNVPLSIAEKDPEGIEYNEILGNNLLKRFNAIIDLQKFEIYLKPNNLLNSEY